MQVEKSFDRIQLSIDRILQEVMRGRRRMGKNGVAGKEYREAVVGGIWRIRLSKNGMFLVLNSCSFECLLN